MTELRNPKKWLAPELHRNNRNEEIYKRLLRRAYGKDMFVLAGHHIVIMQKGQEDAEEIPSADALLFCHECMGLAFGDRAVALMQELVALLPGAREERLSEALSAIGA